MKSSLRLGASRAPKTVFPTKPNRSRTSKTRRIAGLSAVLAVIVGVGASSAAFVDYLADRALTRAAGASPDAGPIVAQTSSAAIPDSQVVADASMDMPEPAAAKPLVEPAARPVKTEIVAAMPAAEAIAKVAAKVGPEHAIELPTDDPTANPVLQLDDMESVDTASLEPVEGDAAPEVEALPLNAEDEVSDDTFTAAIPPDAAEMPVAEPQPKRPPKAKQTATAKQPAKTKPAAENTEIAALPGVDIGGLAGSPAPNKATAGNSASVTKTVVKRGARVSTAVNLRASPENDAGVIAVVPAKAAVNVLGCDKWCQVTYNGKTGWVYGNFVTTKSRPAKKKAASALAKQPAKPAAAPAAVATPAPAATQPAATKRMISSRT